MKKKRNDSSDENEPKGKDEKSKERDAKLEQRMEAAEAAVLRSMQAYEEKKE